MLQKKENKKLHLKISLLGVVCAFFLMGVFLITAVEAVAYWTPNYYEKEYTKYNVLNDLPEMTMDDLLTVTDEMMSYLRGKRDDLHVFTFMGGEYREFFNEREISHMEDVRELFIGGLWIRRIGLLLTIFFVSGLRFWSRQDSSRRTILKEIVPRSLCIGTGIFFAAALFIAAIISTDFSKYFVVFHHIFFDNDLWLLDPHTDMLINLVPEPFFMDTAFWIAVIFACMVIVFLAINFHLWKHEKKQNKNSAALVLSITLCFSQLYTQTSYAMVSWPSGISIEADGGILMDANSGTVLYGKNVHEAYYPASITKVLTAWIILTHCDMDEIVTFTHSAVNTLEAGASIVGARVGDKMTVKDCLYALLLQSANEVANALAEHCSGSVEEFAVLMNEEAKKLGCTDSNFANPSGLNDPNHYTSAYDMALIAKAAFSDPKFVEIDSTLYYDIPAGQLQQYPDGWRYYAHHRMLKKNDSNYYEGIIGGKTGYTSLAGNTLITCAERNGMKLITVVLNGHQTHYSDTKRMMDFGFENFQSVAIADKDSTYQQVENDLTIGGISSGASLKLSIDKDSVITLPAEGNFSDVTSTLDYYLGDTAPESAVARIDYMYGERIVGQAYLEVSETPDVSSNLSESKDMDTITTEPETESTISEKISESKISETSALSDSGKTNFSIFPILKIVLFIGAVIGIIGTFGFAVFMYREKKEQEAMMIRRQRREKRRREWGATSEFNLTMQEHLRSKNQFKKRSFFDRFRK